MIYCDDKSGTTQVRCDINNKVEKGKICCEHLAYMDTYICIECLIMNLHVDELLIKLAKSESP